MKKLAEWFISEESGQGLVEYALILVVIAAGLVLVLGQLKGQLETSFKNAADELAKAKGK